MTPVMRLVIARKKSSMAAAIPSPLSTPVWEIRRGLATLPDSAATTLIGAAGHAPKAPLSSQAQLSTTLLVGIHKDDRSLSLSLRNLPVRAEQSILLFCGNQAEAVTLVKSNGPLGGGPGADQ
jgi:hypothetical protein